MRIGQFLCSRIQGRLSLSDMLVSEDLIISSVLKEIQLADLKDIHFL